jgi:hypothetical protein
VLSTEGVAVMVTLSADAPTSSEMSRRNTWSTARVNSERLQVRNPGDWASSEYRPGVRYGIVKSPTSFDEPGWEMLVSRLVTLMETPGTTAPVASVTRPTTLAEGV